MVWIFCWEYWNGKLTPVKRSKPFVGSLDLMKEREVPNTRVVLEGTEPQAPLDYLAERYPAPELPGDAP